MAKENWVDHVLNRAKDAPIIGRAAAYVADRRETARQQDAFWKSADVSISNHEHELQMKEWRNALPQTHEEKSELVTPRQLWEHEEAHNEQLIQAMRDSPTPGDDGITIVKSSNWHIAAGGNLESRSDIGRSDKGYHFRIDRTDNHTFDVEGNWSKPLKTQEIAEHVAFAQEMSGNGEKWHLSDRRLAGIEAQERPRSPRGEVAHRLDAAAYNRDWAMHDKAHGRDEWANRNIDYAKRNIEAAREIRILTSISHQKEKTMEHELSR